MCATNDLRRSLLGSRASGNPEVVARHPARRREPEREETRLQYGYRCGGTRRVCRSGALLVHFQSSLCWLPNRTAALPTGGRHLYPWIAPPLSRRLGLVLGDVADGGRNQAEQSLIDASSIVCCLLFGHAVTPFPAPMFGGFSRGRSLCTDSR